MKDIDNSIIVDYILKTNANVRETAKHFGVSRQTISNRIKKTNNKEVKHILHEHFKYKSKVKYLRLANNKEN